MIDTKITYSFFPFLEAWRRRCSAFGLNVGLGSAGLKAIKITASVQAMLSKLNSIG